MRRPFFMGTHPPTVPSKVGLCTRRYYDSFAMRMALAEPCGLASVPKHKEPLPMTWPDVHGWGLYLVGVLCGLSEPVESRVALQHRPVLRVYPLQDVRSRGGADGSRLVANLGGLPVAHYRCAKIAACLAFTVPIPNVRVEDG